MDRGAERGEPFWREDGFITISKSEYNLLKALASKEFERFFYALEKSKPKRQGAPPKVKYQNLHCERAFWLWMLAKNISTAQGVRLDRNALTNRELIRVARSVGDKIPNHKRLFHTGSDETLETSVSRGIKELEINDEWQSDVCEKILAS